MLTLKLTTTPIVEALEEFIKVFPKKAPEAIDRAIVMYLLK